MKASIATRKLNMQTCTCIRFAYKALNHCRDIENQPTGISFPVVVVAVVFFNHFDDNIDIDESDVTDVKSNSIYLLF